MEPFPLFRFPSCRKGIFISYFIYRPFVNFLCDLSALFSSHYISTWCYTIHILTNQERNVPYVSCPTSKKAATLHEFTFTMSNCNYCPLSRRDTQLNNHYTLHSLSSNVVCSSVSFASLIARVHRKVRPLSQSSWIVQPITEQSC